MELDRKQLQKLTSMDDESFVALARAIAEAAGASKAKTEIMLSNPELLKRRLASVSPEEAQALIDSAGEEKSREIFEMLKKRGVDFGR